MRLRLEYLFYVLGIIFLFITVWYFARDIFANLDDRIKTVIFILLIVIFFIAGEVMWEKDV